MPLAQNPLFTDDVRQGKTIEALRITQLDQSLVAKLDMGQKQLEAWDDFDWENVVSGNVLTTAQRDALLFTTQVSRLTGEQYGLVDAARKAGLQQTADLVKWDRSNWLDLIRKTPGSIPDAVTPEAYATSLAKTVQQTFPSEYFSYRIADKTAAQSLATAWSEMRRRLEPNPDLLQSLDPGDVDWTGINGTQQPALTAQLSEVAALVSTYRYLGVADVLADGTTTAAQKGPQNGRRIDALDRFLQNNSAEDLRYLNLLNGSATAGTGTGDSDHVDWTGIAPADQIHLRNQLFAYQRVLHLAGDHDTATALLRAASIRRRLSLTLAMGRFASRPASMTPAARLSIARRCRKRRSSPIVCNCRKDAISGFEQGRYFQGIDPSFVNDLKDLPGYADLFGNTSYCDCEDCRSIFSPAAYFTDLMYFIQKNITKPAFAGKRSIRSPLNIRHPDLWKLKLTCDNTDTLIPHLTLVIEILESYLEQTLAIQDVAQTLAGDRSAIGLPYHVPLATVRPNL